MSIIDQTPAQKAEFLVAGAAAGLASASALAIERARIDNGLAGVASVASDLALGAGGSFILRAPQAALDAAASAAASSGGTAAIETVDQVLAVRNLFDTTKITDNSVLQNGATSPIGSNGNYVTDYIPVKPGDVMRFSHPSGLGTTYSVQFFNAGRTANVGNSGAAVVANTDVTIPSAARWARASFTKTSAPLAAMMAARGTVLPSNYVPFGVPDHLSVVSTAQTMARANTNLAARLPITYTTGFFLTPSGGKTASTGQSIARIPAPGGSIVTLSTDIAASFGMVWEDAFGRRTAVAGTGTTGPIAGGKQYTAPAGNAWLEYSVADIYKTPTDWSQRFYAMDGAVTLPANAMPNVPATIADNRPWWGRKWAGQGTSIDANQNWLAGVGKVHGAASVLNWALGGSDNRHNMLDKNNAAIQQAAVVDLDLIYLSQFTNDLATGVARGTSADALTDFTADFSGTTMTVSTFGSGPALAVGQSVWHPSVTPNQARLPIIVPGGTGTGGTGTYTLDIGQGTLSGVASVAMPTTTWGLVRHFIRQMRKWNPTVRIVLETPIQRFESAPTNYANMLSMRQTVLDIADVFSCPVNDLFRDSGANEYTYTGSSATGWTADGVHPTTAGYVACKIQPTIGFLYRVRPTTAPFQLAA